MIPYSFLYAADDDATAVSEVLLRDLPLDERGARLLPRARLRNLRIGWLTTNRDLQLVDLRSGRDLAAIGQDTWLTDRPGERLRTYTGMGLGDPRLGAVVRWVDLALASRTGGVRLRPVRRIACQTIA